MERQTDLTLEEMMKEMRTQSGCHSCHSGGSGLPACLLANEVGVMAHNGDLVAEAFLCELMIGSNDMNLKAISYAYIKNLPRKQPGTDEAIKFFLAGPQNAEIIKFVAEKEAEEREERQRMADLADRHLPGNS